MLFRTAHTIGYFGTEIIWMSMLVKNLDYFDQTLFRTARAARLKKIWWLFRYRNNYRFAWYIISTKYYFELHFARAPKNRGCYFGSEIVFSVLFKTLILKGGGLIVLYPR